MKKNPMLLRRLAVVLTVVLLAPSCEKAEEVSGNAVDATQAKPIEKSMAERSESAPTQPPAPIDAKLNRPVPSQESPAPKAAVTPPEIVTDPSKIEMDKGFPQPMLGDKIYTWSNLPENGCGAYWVKGPNGKVSRISICRDQH